MEVKRGLFLLPAAPSAPLTIREESFFLAAAPLANQYGYVTNTLITGVSVTFPHFGIQYA